MNTKIENLKEANTPVSGYFLLQDAQIKMASNNQPFLLAKLKDKTGTIMAKMWKYSGPINSGDNGQICFVSGTTDIYQNVVQINIQDIKIVQPESVPNIDELIQSAPIDAQQAIDHVIAVIDSIKDKEYQMIAIKLFAEKREEFSTIPAAKTMHHSFRNGLLMHTDGMLRIAEAVSQAYDKVIDRDLLLTGTLLHDFAKIEEFEVTNLGTVANYTQNGALLGHLYMGAERIAEIGKELGISEEKTTLLQHMILAHHGLPEYGAAVKPMIPEAEALFLIDMIDSRLEIFAEAFSAIEPGTFTDSKGLQRKIYKETSKK